MEFVLRSLGWVLEREDGLNMFEAEAERSEKAAAKKEAARRATAKNREEGRIRQPAIRAARKAAREAQNATVKASTSFSRASKDGA
jgi:hypothetical protein